MDGEFRGNIKRLCFEYWNVTEMANKMISRLLMLSYYQNLCIITDFLRKRRMIILSSHVQYFVRKLR